MKPEQDLICGLLNVLGVRPPHDIPHPFLKDARPGTLPDWKGGQVVPIGDKQWNAYSIQQLEDAARRGGSDNHIKLRLGCGVAAGEPGADAAAVAWLTENEQKRGWDGNEPGCRNDYGVMHRGSDLVFLRFGSAALRDIAGRSMDLERFWSWTQAPITGQRSAVSGREQRGLRDEESDFLAGRGPFPAALPATWDRLLIKALEPELRAVAARPLANPKCAMATPTDLYVGDEAAASVQAADVDTNTDAVLVCREEKDASRTRTWAPTPPWGRIREQASGGRVAIVKGALGLIARYTSRLLGSVDVPLPVKNLRIYHLGSGGTLPDGAVATAVQVPPPAAGPGGRPVTPPPAPAAAASVLPKAGPTGCLILLAVELVGLAVLAWGAAKVLG